MMELITAFALSLIVLSRLSDACPDLCICDESVEKLTCKNIKITPEKLQKLAIPSTIKEIYFSGNELTKISSEILRPFKHVTKLEISRNLIQSIPPYTFREFKNLTWLRLNNNDIRELHQHAFAGLSKLERLELSENKLTYLYEGMFAEISSIQSLKLMNNKIESIPNGVFSRLPLLRLLFIRHNEISFLADKAFQNMTMNRIDLSYNRIKRLHRSTFLKFNIKLKIMLYFNPLECNCKDAMTYAKDFKGMQNDIWAFCNSPPSLKGKSILTAYAGTECTMCDLNLCQNGGNCQGNKTAFSCMCRDQYKGTMCESSICKPEIRYVKKVIQLPSTTVLKYVDRNDDNNNSSLLERKNNELETKLMILYAICSLELVIILCFVGLLIMGKYQDWRLMQKYNKQKSPHILEKFRNHVDADNPSGKGYISISELIPYSY